MIFRIGFLLSQALTRASARRLVAPDRVGLSHLWNPGETRELVTIPTIGEDLQRATREGMLHAA
jgi:hypothetical protein